MPAIGPDPGPLPVQPWAVSNEDVIAMTKAGVNEEVIVSHVNNNGILRPLNTADITYLTQNGVSSRVIQSVQNPARRAPHRRSWSSRPRRRSSCKKPTTIRSGVRGTYRPYPYYGGYSTAAPALPSASGSTRRVLDRPDAVADSSS